MLQHCESCGKYVFYPRYCCTACGSRDMKWLPVTGLGTVYTYTIARRATHPRLADKVPYPIVVVELDEGPRMTSTVVDLRPEDISIGMRVAVAFEDHGDLSIPVFESSATPSPGDGRHP